MSRVVGFLFCAFFFLTIRDLYQAVNQPAHSPSEDVDLDNFEYSNVKKEIPSTSFSQIPSANVITIKYCYSCGYAKAFEQYAQDIQRLNPKFLVKGEHYNPPGGRLFIAQFISMAKFAFFIIVLTGFWPNQLDAIVSPSIKAWIFNHKMYACLMVFFLSNAFEGSLLSSGAFEIYYDGKLLSSKIKTGRIMTPKELLINIDPNLITDSIPYDF